MDRDRDAPAAGTRARGDLLCRAGVEACRRRMKRAGPPGDTANASGVGRFRLTAGDFSDVRKLLLVERVFRTSDYGPAGRRTTPAVRMCGDRPPGKLTMATVLLNYLPCSHPYEGPGLLKETDILPLPTRKDRHSPPPGQPLEGYSRPGRPTDNTRHSRISLPSPARPASVSRRGRWRYSESAR